MTPSRATPEIDGAKVRARRLKLGMTLRDLERLSGITNSQLSKIERGICQPYPSNRLDLAGALRTTLKALSATKKAKAAGPEDVAA